MSNVNELLAKIQKELIAPKNQWNAFGKYNYRSCEDILEGVKPLLDGATLTLNDEMVMLGDRFYVKAVAALSLKGETVSVSAMARESLTKKGMDDSQVTGATSSYARKYALNGLFAIDDEKDADSKDNSKQSVASNQDDDKPWYNEPDYQVDLSGITAAIRGGTSADDIIKEISQKFKVANKYRDLIKGIS